MTGNNSVMTHRVGQADGNGRPAPAIDWEAELAAHRGWLRRVIAARTGESQAVDDVWQEVAAAAVGQRAPIADPTKVAPWLYRVAVLQAIRYRRGRARQRHHETRRVRISATPFNGEEIPLQWLLNKERRQQVRAALARLTGRDAEILMLKYFENWSYRQLAARLGISEKAVDSRLLRARARLRAQLAGLMTEDEPCPKTTK